MINYNKFDFYEILNAYCERKLDEIKIKWTKQKSLCVVLCSKGYPENYKKNVEIKNIDKLKLSSNDYLFHAGTSKIKDSIFATGGRVLNFVSLSDNFFQSRDNIQKHLKDLNWLGGFFRKDIGFKVIEK